MHRLPLTFEPIELEIDALNLFLFKIVQFSTDECQDEEGKDTGICNNGICVDEEGSYQCFCRPGFSGHDCSQDIQECLSKPCQNNGTCIDQVASYICECQPVFKGNQFIFIF